MSLFRTLPRAAHNVRPPVLLSAAIVCNTDDRLAGLDHVGEMVSSYLDHSRFWTLEKAACSVLPHLLRRLEPSAPSPSYFDVICDRCHGFAACAGQLPEMKTLDSLFPDLIIREAVAPAAGNGHTDVLRWLYSRRGGVCWNSDIINIAAGSGIVSAVQFLLDRFPPTTPEFFLDILKISIANGQNSMTRYIWQKLLGMGPSETELTEVVSRAPLPLAQWMMKSPQAAALVVSIDRASLHGDLAFVRWAQNHRSVATTQAMDLAATYGHLELLKWLHENRTEGCTTHAMDSAAAHGHFEVLRWLHENRTEGCTSQAFFMAATRGRLDIVEWLFLHRTEGFPPNTFDHVCANGRLQTAQWLTANCVGGGSVNAMDWAAAQGHLQLLQWLHRSRSEGCTVVAMDAAACHGNFDVVRWLHENRTEGCTTNAIDHAAGNGHIDIVKWLASNQEEWCTTIAMDDAARGGHQDMLQWLNDHPLTSGCTTDAMDNAAAEGRFEIVKWLHRSRNEGGTFRAVDAAAWRGDLNMLEFFSANRPEQPSEAAFRSCVLRGDLHTACWITVHYPAAVNMQVVLERSSFNGWTNAIIAAAFSAYL